MTVREPIQMTVANDTGDCSVSCQCDVHAGGREVCDHNTVTYGKGTLSSFSACRPPS